MKYSANGLIVARNNKKETRHLATVFILSLSFLLFNISFSENFKMY